jgi:hypothetical protein
MSETFKSDGTRNDEWNGALRILNADGVTWSYVSASNPLPITGVGAAASPSAEFNEWDISTTNPLPTTS